MAARPETFNVSVINVQKPVIAFELIVKLSQKRVVFDNLLLATTEEKSAIRRNLEQLPDLECEVADSQIPSRNEF